MSSGGYGFDPYNDFDKAMEMAQAPMKDKDLTVVDLRKQAEKMAKDEGITQEETNEILDKLANEPITRQDLKGYKPTKPVPDRSEIALESIAESLKRLADKLAPPAKRPPIVDSEEMLQPRRPKP